MAVMDWCAQNEHSDYPFVPTNNTSLPKNEILDCRFHLRNTTSNTVWLQTREITNEKVKYIFACEDYEPLVFEASRNENGPLIVKQANDDWNGTVILQVNSDYPE